MKKLWQFTTKSPTENQIMKKIYLTFAQSMLYLYRADYALAVMG